MKSPRNENFSEYELVAAELIAITISTAFRAAEAALETIFKFLEYIA